MENKSLYVLKNSKDFEQLKSKGLKAFIDKKILISYMKNNQEHHRVGWTLSRSVGNSVLRNRLKRYSREFFRSQSHLDSKTKIDVNLIFLKSGSHHFKSMGYNDFKEMLLPHWQKITNRI